MTGRVPVINDEPDLLQEASNADTENLEDAVVKAFSHNFPKATREKRIALAERLFSLVGQLWVLQI